MNFSIPMSFGLTILVVILALGWAVLAWSRRSARARQWLFKSTLLGAVIGPVLVYALHPTMAKLLSWMPNQGLWLECMIIAGLTWGLIAASLKALPFDPDYPQPVEIQWRRYLISIVGLALLAVTAARLPVSPALVLSAGLVMLAVLTSAWYPVRLLNGLIGGLIILVVLGVISIITSSVWADLPRVWTLTQGVYVGLDWPMFVLAFSLGLAIPGLTAWWLNQPSRTPSP